MTTFLSDNWLSKTRRPHQCFWCGGQIERGSPACRSVGKFEGDFWHGYLHPECCAARDAVSAENGEWSANGEYARGRRDDDRDKPAEYPAGYRGRKPQTAITTTN